MRRAARGAAPAGLGLQAAQKFSICAPQELQNDLADRCEELRAAQRKLVMARTASNAAAMETAGPQPLPAAPAKEMKR